jgi:hypothetical protein
MTAAPLECLDCQAGDHVRPCVRSLACWWREARELEHLLGYARSSLRARDAWDELLAAEVPSPRTALYVELRSCIETWTRLSDARRGVYPSLLNRLVEVATVDSLELPHYAVLAAFRLRQRLSGMR